MQAKQWAVIPTLESVLSSIYQPAAASGHTSPRQNMMKKCRQCGHSWRGVGAPTRRHLQHML